MVDQTLINLVIAAREAFDTGSLPADEESALDRALEPYSAVVAYAGEPPASADPAGEAQLRSALEYVREHLLRDPCPIGRRHARRVVDAALSGEPTP